jgi:hypothetical protein
MVSQTAVQARIINDLVAEVCDLSPDADPVKIASRAEELFEEMERRDTACRSTAITDEIIQARLDCLIFFNLVIYGWGKAKRLPSGAVVSVDAPASFDERLNFPSRYRLWTASKRVRQTCPEEAAGYKKAWRDWREARKRYLATETEEAWEWYRAGSGNRNSVAYRSKVDLNRRGGKEHFRNRRLFRYTIDELLPRQEECERAYRESLEAADVMEQMRDRIFELMGVPPALRR